jgi:hypothetical protein
MSSKFKFIFLLLAWPDFSFAADVDSIARREFDACIKETQADRNVCSFGGCGNIVAACYERQMNAISMANDSLVSKLNTGRCMSIANSTAEEIDGLDSKLKLLAPFDGTWSGYDVQVQVALLKNGVLSALIKECDSKN